MRPWIMVIDSDRAVVNAFKRALERRGLFVLATDSISEGLGALEVDQPEVLILEIRVPGTPGVDLLRTLKATYPAMPIIVMTAHSTSFTESDARREGVAAYFVKPFDIEAMIEELQKTMKKSSSTAALTPAPALARWSCLAFAISTFF